MKQLKRLLWALILPMLLMFGNQALAQISEGGVPPSFLYKSISVLQKKAPFVAPINFNVQELRAEDAKNAALGIVPLRAVKIIPSDITIGNNGEWTTLPSGQSVWQMTIEAPGAIATMLYYDEFYIPEGGKLFIYNKDKTQVLGAYTSATNPMGREFATELVAGDELTLEYVPPGAAKSSLQSVSATIASSIEQQAAEDNTTDQPRIKVSGIGYGYNHIAIYRKNVGDDLMATGYGTSFPCQVNVACSPEGDNWKHQKQGVARILVPVGSDAGWCSGTIVNNTSENLDPLFLSAFHCFEGASVANLNQIAFYFNYESPNCGTPATEPAYKTMIGAQMLVNIPTSAGSDGSLLRMNQTIPSDYNVFYNGWDRSATAATRGVGIHHASGDIKKISTYTAAATSTTWNGVTPGKANAHWRVVYVATANGFSFTEGGSSGSPLFNQNGLVVGTLTGGPTTGSCADAANNASLYGKLWYHWDQHSATDPALQMKTYLDPTNTGQLTIDGMYASGKIVANFSASRTSIYAGESIQLTDMSFNADTYSWTFDGGIPSSSDVANPPAVTFNTPGTHEVKLVINKGTGNEREKAINIVVTQKQQVCKNELTIGTGTDKSQFPLGMSNNHTLSSSIYTKDELGNASGVISQLVWTANNPVAVARTLYIYMKEVDESEQVATTWTNEIAGATLVYQSAASGWANDAGEVAITLATPFTYSGTKNLKVMVRAGGTASTATPARSSDCYYSEKANAHRFWTGTSGSTIPSGNGTIDGKRPNIKLTIAQECGTATLVANFSAGFESVVMKEGFDAVVFPPKGWKMEKPGASTSAWRRINHSAAYYFTLIDPASVSSALVSPDAASMVNTWLKTNSILVPDNGKVEFYTLYQGDLLDKARGSFHISTNGGASWEEKWTAGNVADANLGFKWRKHTVDLSAYAGQEILLGWNYQGMGGGYFLVDGVKVFSVNTGGKGWVYEGEYVQFTDLSTGPPVLWNWNLQGGTPATSAEQNPQIRYMPQNAWDEEISLNASLTVKDNVTSNAKTIPGAVTVKKRTPITDFTAQGGDYTLQSNYGRFLQPKGGSVQFTDNSQYYPTGWYWTLQGMGAPSVQNPQVTYSNPGSFKVKLTAMNAAGVGTLEKPNFIKVGGTADIWNMPNGDAGSTLYTYTYLIYSFYVSGASAYATTYAERFEQPSTSGGINAAKVQFRKGTNGNAPLKVAIHPEVGGVPSETPLVEKTLAAADIQASGYTTVTFDETAYVSGAFYVVVSGISAQTTAANQVAIYTSTDQGEEATGYLKNGTDWYLFSDIWNGAYLSLNIVPTFTYSELDLDTYVYKPTASSASFSDGVTANVPWKATTQDKWINITQASGSGNGQVDFNITANTSFERNGLITVSGGGLTRYITIHQAAAASPVLVAPSNLNATVVGANENDVLLTWENNVLQSASATSLNSLQLAPKSTVVISKPTSEQLSQLETKRIETLQSRDALMASMATEKVLRWDNGTSSDALRFTSGIPFEMGARWDTRDLIAHHGAKMTDVLVYYNAPTATLHELIVYEDGTPIRTQTLSDLMLGFNRVTLTTPITIDATKELIVAYRVTGYAASEYPASFDSGPALDGKGNLYNYAGNWYTYPGGNWNIAAIVENNNSVSYTVFRDGVRIADNLLQTTYTDKNLTATTNAGGYCYFVKATYYMAPTANNESAPSNTKCVDIKRLLTVTAQNATRYVGEPNPSFTFTYSGIVSGHDAASIDTPPTISCTATESSPAGTYPIVLTGGQDDYYRFAYVAGTLTVREKPAPLGLTATIQSDVNVRLAWTAATGATGYKVYRDGVEIAAQTAVTYTDSNVSSGYHAYYVVAVYKPGVESNPSSSASAFIKHLLIVTVENVSRFVGEPNPPFVLRYQGFVNGQSAANLLTAPTATTLANESSPTGNYDITIAGGASDIYRFSYVKGTLTVMSSGSLSSVEPSSDADLYRITINGVEHDITQLYDAGCGESELNVAIETDPNAKSSINSGTTLSIAKPTLKEVTFTITSEDKTTTKSYTLVVEKRFDFDAVVVKKWGNTLMLNLKKLEDEGYRFTAYKWYKNNELIGTGSYYSAGSGQLDKLDATGRYHVELYTTDGKVLRTCASTVVLKAGELLAYPNPVKPGGVVYIKSEDSLPADAVVDIYTVSGVKVGAQVRVSGDQAPVAMPTAPGVYLLKLSSKEGLNQTFKVIVN